MKKGNVENKSRGKQKRGKVMGEQKVGKVEKEMGSLRVNKRIYERMEK